MISLPSYKDKIVGVFGLGRAGEATVAALRAGGARVVAWDDKFSKTTAELVPFADWPWAELECVVLSPGVPLTHPTPHGVVQMAKRYNKPIIGDIELLCTAQPQAKKIAITGTNGKSTTTSLIAHILKEARLNVEVGGNLGTPALSLAPLDASGFYVLETSSYQLDLLKRARFDIAVFLNITPDHLDRHGSMEGYVAAKMHIFDRQEKGDVAVIAAEDDYTRRIAGLLKQYPAEVIEVSSQPTINDLDLRTIPTLTGKHNWQNANAAYAACRAAGLAHDEIARAMKTYPGLPHRLQLAATIRGVRFINDSKGTNADATANALAPYDNIYWIAGGKPKSGGIETLASFFPKIAHAFLIGEASDAFARTLEGHAPYTTCGTLDVAVAKAAEMAWREQKKDAVVLLSPACASFDQFANFEERGDMFCQLVSQLEAQHAA